MNPSPLRRGFVFLGILLASPLFAQEPARTGSVEFVALITPTGGRAEAALNAPIHLLRKSWEEIRKEAEQAIPAPDLDAFVDSLNLSPQLKAWMKRTRLPRLEGVEFTHAVSIKDIMEVPEFYEAYITRNAPETIVNFPKPKFTEADREKNPEKFEKQVQEYREKVRGYAERYPHSRDGLELHLVHINPGPVWQKKEAERNRQVRVRALQLAGSTYLVAKTEPDLRGRGGFVNIPSGTYWLSTLEREAVAGDIRLRWDLPVTVSAGQATRLELTNLNAVQPSPVK
jgi:hypothetical protein